MHRGACNPPQRAGSALAPHIGRQRPGDEEYAHEQGAGQKDRREASGLFGFVSDDVRFEPDCRSARGALERCGAIQHDGERLLDNVRQNALRGVANQIHSHGLAGYERHREPGWNDDQRGSVGPVQTPPAFGLRDLFDSQHVSQRTLMEGVRQHGCAERAVFIDDQERSVWAAPARAKYQRQYHCYERGDRKPGEDRNRLAAQAAQVFQRADPHEPHYSLSSDPVSLMKRLSRLGCVSVVPRRSEPFRAAKISGSRCEASGIASANCASSAWITSTPSIRVSASRTCSGWKVPLNRSTSRSPSMARSSWSVPCAQMRPWSTIAKRSHSVSASSM